MYLGDIQQDFLPIKAIFTVNPSFFQCLQRMQNTQLTWSSLFKEIWLPLSVIDSLIPEIIQQIKQCLLDLHYYRRFCTKMKQDLPTTKFMYNTSLETLVNILFNDEASNREHARNTLLYGFPLKLQYHKVPIRYANGKILNDLMDDTDLEALIANTSPKDRIMVHRTRYIPSPLLTMSK